MDVLKRDFECSTGWCDCDSCKDQKGQEEDGTVICGRRPKQFKCVACGGQKFVVVHRRYTVTDFSQEGAIEGHPMLSNGGEPFDSIFCDNCAEPVEGEMEQEMLKEVI